MPSINGSPITSYRIKILSIDLINYYTTSSCDGSDATIVANAYCDIPMATLVNLPFVLV